MEGNYVALEFSCEDRDILDVLTLWQVRKGKIEDVWHPHIPDNEAEFTSNEEWVRNAINLLQEREITVVYTPTSEYFSAGDTFLGQIKAWDNDVRDGRSDIVNWGRYSTLCHEEFNYNKLIEAGIEVKRFARGKVPQRLSKEGIV